MSGCAARHLIGVGLRKIPRLCRRMFLQHLCWAQGASPIRLIWTECEGDCLLLLIIAAGLTSRQETALRKSKNRMARPKPMCGVSARRI